MFPCLCTKLQNAKAVIFLSSTVNTADTGRGGKTCRKDQGISEGPGNTTGGIWISGARRCWGVLTDLTVKNVFFFYYFLTDLIRQVGIRAIQRVFIYLNILTRWILSSSSKHLMPLFIFPFSSKHQPAPIPLLFSRTVFAHPHPTGPQRCQCRHGGASDHPAVTHVTETTAVKGGWEMRMCYSALGQSCSTYSCCSCFWPWPCHIYWAAGPVETPWVDLQFLKIAVLYVEPWGLWLWGDA